MAYKVITLSSYEIVVIMFTLYTLFYRDISQTTI